MCAEFGEDGNYLTIKEYKLRRRGRGWFSILRNYLTIKEYKQSLTAVSVRPFLKLSNY